MEDNQQQPLDFYLVSDGTKRTKWEAKRPLHEYAPHPKQPAPTFKEMEDEVYNWLKMHTMSVQMAFEEIRGGIDTLFDKTTQTVPFLRQQYESADYLLSNNPVWLTALNKNRIAVSKKIVLEFALWEEFNSISHFIDNQGVFNTIKHYQEAFSLILLMKWIKREVRVFEQQALFTEKKPLLSSQYEEKASSVVLPDIFIVPEGRQILYDAIFSCVDEHQRPSLYALIFDGDAPYEPIKFHCNQNSLAYIFRQLSEPSHKLIKGTQIDIAKWVCTKFTPTNFDTIYDVIRGKNKPAKSGRIKINI